MARNRSVRWNCLWWCLLCCVLSPVTFAAKKTPTFPSYATGMATGKTATKSNGVLTIGEIPLTGEFIPAPAKNIPVNGIMTGLEFGVDKIGKGVGNIMKRNIGSMVAIGAVTMLMDGVDWVMIQGEINKKGTGLPVPMPGDGNIVWGWEGNSTPYYSATEACAARGKQLFAGYSSVSASVSGSVAGCVATITRPDGTQIKESEYTVQRWGDKCPTNSNYESVSGTCVGVGAFVPVTDADYTVIEDYISGADAPYLKDLLTGTQSVDPSFYNDLAPDYIIQSGPSSVPAGSSSSTTTTQNPDGTTSNTVTTTNNTYEMTYNKNDFNYSPVTTTTTSVNGRTTSVTTTAEAETPGTTPGGGSQVSEQTKPVPCGAGCVGPKYVDLYTETEMTKEGAIDSYYSRVKALPIINAVGGFFNVTAGAGCPVWSVNTSAQIFTATFPINLVFDYHCQGWFTSFGSYASVVFAIVCSFLAFRIAMLD